MRISDWSSDVCSSDLTMARSCRWCPASCHRSHSSVPEVSVSRLRVSEMVSTAMPSGWNVRLSLIPGIFIHLLAPTQRVFPIQRGRLEPSRRAGEHTSELQSLMRISYADYWLKKKA